jgi:hypothetical protein
MTRNGNWRIHAGVVLAYAVVAIVFTWPLVLHLGTHLTGGVGGDTGVYVWNQWVFRHQLLNLDFPYVTDTLFGHHEPANLSLHNYTRFQNLISVPIARFAGVVRAFNLVYLLMTVLTAYTTFLLARHVTRRVGEAWLAGLIFAWGPLLVTRGMGHFSLVAAAPLAMFLFVLMRADGHERLRDAVALGATMGWAASTDAYYAVYCLLLGATFVAVRVVSIVPSPRAGHASAVRWGLDVLILCVGALAISMVASGGWQIDLLGQPVRMRSLYTPMLVLTLLCAIRVAWAFRASVAPITRDDAWRFARLATVTGLVGAAVMSPVLYAAALRISGGNFVTPSIFWRSSPPGVDVLALILPNPNHPLAPSSLAAWLATRPNGYLENVASIPIVGLAVLFVAWRGGWRPSRWWAGLAIGFGLLALGPFINVGGINTFVPGPWAFLRYVPLVGLAHTPARIAIVMMLAGAVLFATALDWLGRRYPARRRSILTVVGVLLAFELLPAPLALHSAAVPPLYRHVAAAPQGITLLELPYGVRDGTYSVGNFSARTQFYQTAHGKTIMGGYLSRVSRRRLEEVRADPVRNALALLSESKTLTLAQEAAFVDAGPAFITQQNVAFVVIDRDYASPEFQGLAIRAFRLQHVETNGSLALYATAPPIPR